MAEATVATRERLFTIPVLSEDDSFVSAEKILYAVQRIVELARPVKVVAFGSRARGDHRPESDLDLVVILDQFDPATDKRPVARTDLDVSMPIDLLVVSRERHEYMRDSMISLHHDIEQEGVVLYDSSVGSIDYRAVERIARCRSDARPSVADRIFGFHAQQAVEKLLKALIGAHAEKYKYTHDLAELVRHCSALGEQVALTQTMIDELTDFAVVTCRGLSR